MVSAVLAPYGRPYATPYQQPTHRTGRPSGTRGARWAWHIRRFEIAPALEFDNMETLCPVLFTGSSPAKPRSHAGQVELGGGWGTSNPTLKSGAHSHHCDSP